MNKKQQMKQRVNQILIQIHKGFLTKEQAAEVTDEQILANIPDNKGAYKTFERPGKDPHEEARITPFSYKWVKKQLKKDPTLTAYDMLMNAGFKEQANDI